MFALFFKLGVAVAVGVMAIVVLVGIVWRRRSRRLAARSRPASPEARDRDRLDALRKIAASDYRPKRHEVDRKD